MLEVVASDLPDSRRLVATVTVGLPVLKHQCYRSLAAADLDHVSALKVHCVVVVAAAVAYAVESVAVVVEAGDWKI